MRLPSTQEKPPFLTDQPFGNQSRQRSLHYGWGKEPQVSSAHLSHTYGQLSGGHGWLSGIPGWSILARRLKKINHKVTKDNNHKLTKVSETVTGPFYISTFYNSFSVCSKSRNGDKNSVAVSCMYISSLPRCCARGWSASTPRPGQSYKVPSHFPLHRRLSSLLGTTSAAFTHTAITLLQSCSSISADEELCWEFLCCWTASHSLQRQLQDNGRLLSTQIREHWESKGTESPEVLR